MSWIRAPALRQCAVALPNLIITPHVSAIRAAEEQRTALLRENLRRYVAGEPMLSVVDVGRGY